VLQDLPNPPDFSQSKPSNHRTMGKICPYEFMIHFNGIVTALIHIFKGWLAAFSTSHELSRQPAQTLCHLNGFGIDAWSTYSCFQPFHTRFGVFPTSRTCPRSLPIYSRLTLVHPNSIIAIRAGSHVSTFPTDYSHSSPHPSILLTFTPGSASGTISLL
jgi:hypothetical protein